jgi:hypothetical protein
METETLRIRRGGGQEEQTRPAIKDLDSTYFAAREPPEDDRAAWLALACEDDGAVRTRVEQMLAVADKAEAFIADSAVSAPALVTVTSEQFARREKAGVKAEA